jgi:hypothetical protein
LDDSLKPLPDPHQSYPTPRNSANVGQAFPNEPLSVVPDFDPVHFTPPTSEYSNLNFTTFLPNLIDVDTTFDHQDFTTSLDVVFPVQVQEEMLSQLEAAKPTLEALTE